MISNFSDLKRCLKILREQGVTEATVDGMTFKLGELPVHRTAQEEMEEGNDPYKNFPQGELTPEQLAFYSSGGLPEDDPWLKGEQ